MEKEEYTPIWNSCVHLCLLLSPISYIITNREYEPQPYTIDAYIMYTNMLWDILKLSANLVSRQNSVGTCAHVVDD